ncbi:hypothetical protein PQX77_001398 [Marasmius sp. AFHP31]|nr:hypothetical protein PQX77_001398 [Marasmius sp. AFHP31]
MATKGEPTVQHLFSLTNRTSIVTGGARGLGITLANALVEAGSHVFCLDILPEPSPQEWNMLLEKARSAGGLTVRYKQVDVTKPELVEAVMSEIVREAPEKVRVLVAAAGIQQDCPAIEYNPNDMRRIMDVNVVGTFNIAQAVARSMIDHGQGGSMILIASMSGSIANRGLNCTA